MQDAPELRQFLTNIAIFGGLEDPTVGRIVGMLQEHHFAKGAVVCKEGEPGTSIYIVREGEVVVCRNGESGKLVKVIRLGAGELFGEMTLIDIQPRSATVIVESVALVYSLTNLDLYKLYTDDMPGYVMVIQNLCRELSRRLRRADSKITDTADQFGDDKTQIPGFAPPK
jgi:CRP/FNR family cyclic AMP-dependent transcriptional regulator